jgi:hypothetical protein
MTEPSVSPDRLGRAGRRSKARQAVKVAGLESAASWAVRRTLESAYHATTGREPPTARDRDVPFRRVVAWAAVTAAAVAMANVAVDRFVLRREPPDNA